MRKYFLPICDATPCTEASISAATALLLPFALSSQEVADYTSDKFGKGKPVIVSSELCFSFLGLLDPHPPTHHGGKVLPSSGLSLLGR